MPPEIDPVTPIVSMRLERIGELSWLILANDTPQSILYATEEDVERSNIDGE